MTGRLIILVLVVMAASVAPAAAHSPIKGIGTFYNGLLHPALVPAHLLGLAAVGLLIGQNAPSASRLALPAFAVAAAFALVVTFIAPRALPAWPLLATALAGGLAVAVGWSGSFALTVALAVFAGALIAFDSAPDGIPVQEVWIALAGTSIGMVLLVTYFGGLAAWFDRPWQKIAVRAAGSWIAASALLVLALNMLEPGGMPA